METRGKLFNILLEKFPGVHNRYVRCEGGQNIFHVRIPKLLYVMLVYLIMYYKKFRKGIEGIGFEFNPYDICVANRMKSGKRKIVIWRVDYLKSSHVDPKVNDKFAECCEETYGSDNSGHVKVVGKKFTTIWLWSWILLKRVTWILIWNIISKECYNNSPTRSM